MISARLGHKFPMIPNRVRFCAVLRCCRPSLPQYTCLGGGCLDLYRFAIYLWTFIFASSSSDEWWPNPKIWLHPEDWPLSQQTAPCLFLAVYTVYAFIRDLQAPYHGSLLTPLMGSELWWKEECIRSRSNYTLICPLIVISHPLFSVSFPIAPYKTLLYSWDWWRHHTSKGL